MTVKRRKDFGQICCCTFYIAAALTLCSSVNIYLIM